MEKPELKSYINKIICADCLTIMRQLPDKCVDLVVTSPPYDNLRKYNGYLFDFENIAKELFRVIKDGGVVVWVVGDQIIDGEESGESFRQALFFKSIGFRLYDTMIYEKAACIYPGGVRYNQVVEYMFILSKGKPKTINLIDDKPNKYAGQSARGVTHRNLDGSMKNNDSFKGKPTKEFGVRNNIWRYGTGWMVSTPDEIAYEHPAIFPEDLARDHIISWSNKGDLVMDIFSGSGTTAKMAFRNGRDYIAIDISEEYCKKARARILQAETGVTVKEQKAGQKPLFE